MKEFPRSPLAGTKPFHELGEIEYATLLESVPHAVLLIDSQSGQIILGNTQATELSAYTHKEIAGMLGISENTSKSQYLKARKKLQLMLVEYDIQKSQNQSLAGKSNINFFIPILKADD